MRIRNKTGIIQVAPKGSHLAPGVWLDVPGDVRLDDAIWMHKHRLADLTDLVDSEDYLWKSDAGTHLYWMSPFSLGDGYATAAESTVHALRSIGCIAELHQCWFLSTDGLRPDTVTLLKRQDTTKGLHRVGLCMSTPGEFKKLPTPYRIGLTMYESDDPLKNNPQWRHDCAEVDMLIVPCDYCKDVFEQFVRVPVKVAALAINPDYYIGQKRAPKDTFTFVMFGTLSGRKAPLETLTAFKTAFPIDKYPDARIVFKTRLNYFGWGENQLPSPDPDSRIQIVNGDWYTPQMLEWLLSADAMVYPSKGEGYGMPPREAIATGLPTILGNHTGHIPICDDRYTWPIPVAKIEESPLGGNWHIPDWDYMIDVMRWMYNNREETYQKGFDASVWYKRVFGTKRVASYLLKIIESANPPDSAIRQSREPRAPKETVEEHVEFFDFIESSVPKPGPIWDVGVGEGLASQELLRRGYEVIAVVHENESESARERLAARDLNLPIVVLSNGSSLLPVLRRPGRARPAACVSVGVLQNLGNREIITSLDRQLAVAPRVFFSVPSVYYPEYYREGARMMSHAHWLDILSPLACVFRAYGRDDRFFVGQARKRIDADGVVTRRRGRMLQGVWHENR